MSFKKDAYRVAKTKAALGRNIIITDNTDWSTAEIVQASLDRWKVEDAFRLSNDDDLVSIRPVRHWTDSKIRCHLFSCVVALTYLRRLEIHLRQHGIGLRIEHATHSLPFSCDKFCQPSRPLTNVSAGATAACSRLRSDQTSRCAEIQRGSRMALAMAHDGMSAASVMVPTAAS